MLFSIFLLLLSVNLDSLGVGLVYGIKNIHISSPYKILMCLFSILYSGAAIILGNSVSNFFSSDFCKYIGIGILLFLGLYSIFRSLYPCTKKSSSFKSLDTSINIVKNSTYIDINNSSKIDLNEAILLSFALSIDSMGTSFAFSIIVKNLILIPFLIGLFQLLFLNIGLYLGKKVSTITYNKFINAKTISVLPGILLILIAIFRI